MSKSNSSTSVSPLLCSLCPRTPRFSDMSHLLTHISSKSHLSHRFKLQIRSQSELEAKRQLDDFNDWYDNNGLEALLSERLAAKEVKKEAKMKKDKISKTANVSTILAPIVFESHLLKMKLLLMYIPSRRSRRKRGPRGKDLSWLQRRQSTVDLSLECIFGRRFRPHQEPSLTRMQNTKHLQ